MNELTTSQLAKYTEIPRRTIYRWIDAGLLPVHIPVPGQGPGLSDLHDKAVAVWAMFLDEASKMGVNFSGQGAGQVWLFRQDVKLRPEDDPKNGYDGPHLLGNSAYIVAWLRQRGYELAALILSGKLGFPNQTSRDRFCEIRIVPSAVAFYDIPQFVDPYKGEVFLTGLETTHFVKSVLVVSIHKLSNAFDMAVALR